MVTSVAAFAAALGYVSLPMVFALSLLRDLLPDVLGYWAGYAWRRAAAERVSRWLHVAPGRMVQVEGMIRKSVFRALVMIKVIPLVSLTGSVLFGAARVAFWRFFGIDVFLTVVRSALFLLAGYYFGRNIPLMNHYMGMVGDVLLGVVCLVVVVLVWRQVTRRVVL